MQDANFSIRSCILKALVTVQLEALRETVQVVLSKELRFDLGVDRCGIVLFKRLPVNVRAQVFGVNNSPGVRSPVAAPIDQKVYASLILRFRQSIKQSMEPHIQKILAEAPISEQSHRGVAA